MNYLNRWLLCHRSLDTALSTVIEGLKQVLSEHPFVPLRGQIPSSYCIKLFFLLLHPFSLKLGMGTSAQFLCYRVHSQDD